MIKKSFSYSSSIRCDTKGKRKLKKFLKKYRSKQRRQTADFKAIEKSTGAWILA